MSTEVQPAPASEAAAAPATQEPGQSAGTGVAGIIPAIHSTGGRGDAAPAEAPKDDAAERRARALQLAQDKGIKEIPVALEPGEEVIPDPLAAVAEGEQVEETPEERETRLAAMSPEERAAEEAAAADADAEFVVALPGQNPDDPPFEIEVRDKAAADRMRQLVRGYLRGDQARTLREEAQQLRDQADEFDYMVQLDPAGVMVQTITNPQDQEHLLRYLLTRPGVLNARTSQWIGEMLDTPERIQSEAALVEAERIRRRDAMQGQVQESRELAQNARAIVRTIHKTIDTVAPDTFDEMARDLLYNDVLSDVRAFAKSRGLQKVDPRVVPGLVSHRFKLLGVAAKSKNQATEGKAPSGGTKAPPVAPPPKTAATLKAAAVKRQQAASAPVGAGSAASTFSPPPKYDRNKPGSPVQQAARHARAMVAAFRRKPQ